jgi:putative Holliday junction resolvase
VRFELTVPCGTPVFRTGALNHYATPPSDAFRYYQKSVFYASLFHMATGRFLGIDYGTKRIGVSISDENHTLAFPKEIVENDADTFLRIGEIIKKENVSEIVVGESVDFSGKLNALSGRIEVFILELQEKFKLPVHKQKEFLTSVEARKAGSSKKDFNPSQAHSKVKQIKSGRIDASAAALILQRYLDKKNKEIK